MVHFIESNLYMFDGQNYMMKDGFFFHVSWAIIVASFKEVKSGRVFINVIYLKGLRPLYVSLYMNVSPFCMGEPYVQ